MKCTFQELELINGENIKLTLTFSRLLQVKNKRKKEYEEYNSVFSKKGNVDNTFDAITILYTAYLAANVEHLDDNTLMSKTEFMDSIPQNMNLINIIAGKLTNPKLKKNSEKHSSIQQEE